jgi:hypothetical protein
MAAAMGMQRWMRARTMGAEERYQRLEPTVSAEVGIAAVVDCGGVAEPADGLDGLDGLDGF